jgi:two-component system, OmpR family, sensor kinase
MVDAQQSALDTAETQREATRRFLADAAHQLRTPMAGLRASAEQLLAEHDAQARDRLLANVVRETARSSRLVDALLRMTELEHQPVQRIPTDLTALCRDEIDRACSLAPQLRIELRTADPPVGSIDIDPHAVRDALANLLDNARRHAATTVRISLLRDDDLIVVRVDDDGPGIAEKDKDRVFERFASLDGKGGSGLGLPIAREVARTHGGDLSCEHSGFVFTVAIRDNAPDAPCAGSANE